VTIFIIIAVLVFLLLLIYSNSRVTDVKDSMNRRLDDTKDALHAEIKALHTEMSGGFERIELLLKMHEAEHHRK
jgi:large-conductance mechanosensitive channel